MRITHLSAAELRVLRLALNRLAKTGLWNLDELKIEFEELRVADAPIEISGFTLDEIDQIVIGSDGDEIEAGPLEPDPGAISIARVRDVFQVGPHLVLCGDATDPEVRSRFNDGGGRLAKKGAVDSNRRAVQRKNRWSRYEQSTS